MSAQTILSLADNEEDFYREHLPARYQYSLGLKMAESKSGANWGSHLIRGKFGPNGKYAVRARGAVSRAQVTSLILRRLPFCRPTSS